MIGISQLAPGIDADVLVFGIAGQQHLAHGHYGFVVFQVVAAQVGVIQEGQFVKTGIGLHGLVPHFLPVALQLQILDISGRVLNAAGI